MRMPTNEPAPSPTAIRLTPSHPPAASTARSISASRAVECRGPPSGAGPSSSSWTTSPARVAQMAVSAVAVSKPTTVMPLAPCSVGDAEDRGADAFAFDKPGHPMLARNVRGDLVDVQSALRGRLRFGADVFASRELDADAVVDIAFEAFEEGTLFARLRAFVRRFRVLRDTAGDVVLVRSCSR